MHVDCCFDYLDYVEQYSFDVEYGDCFKQSYTNLYEYDDFCYTNVPVIVKNGELYKCENDILQFF